MRRYARHGLVAILMTLAGVGAGVALGAGEPGDIDDAFNSGDPALIARAQGGDTTPSEFNDVIVDGFGRIIAAGGFGDLFPESLVARLQPSGALDPGFGTNGVVSRSYAAGGDYRGVFRDPAGRLGVAGAVSFQFNQTFASARLTDAGGTDSSYGTDGIATGATRPPAQTSNYFNAARSLLGDDGSTFIAGHTSTDEFNTSPRITVSKLAPNGTPAAYGTFGNGVAQVRLTGTSNDSVADAVNAGSGRILVAGTTDAAGGSRIFVARLTASGALDPAFGGGDGWTAVNASSIPTPTSRAAALAVAPDGSIYVAGTGANSTQAQNMVVVKLTAAGVPEPTFGAGGYALLTPVAAGYTASVAMPAGALAVGNDGKPVLVGSAELGPNPQRRELVLARYLPTGQLDATFSGDGIATHRIPMPTSEPSHTRVERPIPQRAKATGDGKLIVVGRGGEPGLNKFAFVARFVLIRQEDLKFPRTIEGPRLTGVPSPGQTLTCNPGSYTNSPTAITRVFERAPRDTTSDESPAWLPIAGTLGTTYVVTAADLGSRLRCRETAANPEGSSTAVSRSLRVDAGPPVNTTPPAVSGDPIVGRRLTCEIGTWDNAGDFDVFWTLNGGSILEGGRTLDLTDRHRGARIGCQVRASNDVGAAAPAQTAERKVVAAIPRNTRRTIVLPEKFGPRITDLRWTCPEGTWEDDYEQYTYQWVRDGAVIPGATQRTYTTTVDDLGRVIGCRVASTNPLGTSAPVLMHESVVPLPSGGPEGKIFAAGGYNQYDPTNLLAMSADQLGAIKSVVLKRFQDALDARRRACGSSRGLPNWGDAIGRTLTGPETCAVLGSSPAQPISITMNGVFWKPTGCVSDTPIDQPAAPPAGRNAKAAGFASTLRLLAKFVGGVPICPKLGLDVKSVDPARAPALDPLVAAAVAPVAPQQVLWDFDGDNRVDSTCGPDAPIVRTLLNRGIYKVKAVIVDRTSAETGIYSTAQFDLSFFPARPQHRGELRTAQPFACRTSLDPPPEAQAPCVTQGQIGRVQLRGNLCPISLRRVPPGEVGALPEDVQEMLQGQALSLPLRKQAQRPATMFAGTGFPAAWASQANLIARTATTMTNAITGFASPPQLNIASTWQSRLAKLPGFSEAKSQFALDQIYLAKGNLKVNGVDLDPVGGASTVLVPSDVEGAISSVKDMTIASSKTAADLGGVPIGNPEKLVRQLPDKLGVAPPSLKDANLDGLAANLKKKLDLGPFNLAGAVKVKLQPDGTALLEAKAELPALTTSPKSTPIRADVVVRGDRNGRLTLQDVHIRAPGAYLAAVKIKDVDIRYNGSGLNVQGALLFPPVDAGIRINRFRLGPTGAFRELDVDYLAGAGQGIPIGTGTFLTRVGGGLSLDPDEIRGRATVSVGPSSGGGCPTAGIDAEFAVHFAPYPFYVDARGNVQLVCIPLANMGFHADQTGLVRLNGGANLDAGPIYVSAGMNAEFRLPQWQIDVHGKGGIRGVLEANVKAMLSNIGLAGCGRIRVAKIPNPFGDDLVITLAGGAGVRFSGGIPPLSFPQLAAALDLFTGCDLTGYSPFGRDARAAQAGGRSFTLPSGEEVVSLFVTGANGVVRGKLTGPDGKIIDLSQVRDTLGQPSPESSAIAVPAKQRLIVLLGKPKGGRWTFTPDPGSPAISDVRFATKLPPPQVKVRVSGKGARRVLTWDVKPIAGQVVRLVEKARGGERPIAVVRRGGKGSKRFTVSVAKSKARRIVALVQQDGMPRTNLTVARFTAASPKLGRPGRVRIVRTGTTRASVRWTKAAYARSYDVVVTSGDGERRLFTTKRTRVSVSGLTPRTKISVRVIAIDETGRRGRAGTASAAPRSARTRRGGSAR